jgi:RNA polymerase sigma-70 factor (ECF subfamily)
MTDEEALITASKRGDAAALDALVRAHQDRVYAFAMRMCRNVEDAKDILQETFLGMVRSVREFREESKFTTWLYRIASNACLKKRRHGVHDPSPDQELSLDELMPRPDSDGRKPEIADWSEDAEQALLRGELSQRMEAAIDKLPREYKIVLVLRDVEGLSAEETAHAVGLSVAAVKSRLHRARVFVRRELAGYFEGQGKSSAGNNPDDRRPHEPISRVLDQNR